MKFFTVYFLLLIIANELHSKDIIEVYPLDTLQSSLQFSEIDSSKIMFSNIIEGKIHYINGKFERGRLRIPLVADSMNIDFRGDTSTYIVNHQCDCGDTLTVTIERTFHNAMAKESEPNYTAVSKICFRGFEYSVVFPMVVIPSEREIKIQADFKINLSQVFTSLVINEQELSEFRAKLNISLKTE